MKPLVSVIVPMYNAAPWIGEALESIVASTYRPIEVIVADDGSTDESLSVAQAFAENHKEVRVISQPNGGVSRARNHAIREAKGEMILPVDADDRISATYIEHAVAAMRPEVRVVSCKAEFFGAKTGEWKLPAFSPETLARKNMIHVCSLFRRADWEKAGGYAEEDIYREDWDFWLSLIELDLPDPPENVFVLLDEVGLYYRVQDVSRRRKAKAHKRAIVDAINRRHPAYMQRYLGGPLHYHRSWSKMLNRFVSIRQQGAFSRWEDGEVIDSRRNILRRTEGMIVKHFAIPGLWRGLWYGLIGRSKARRSYENALRMAGLTPEPIAYREVRMAGILRESAYVCRESICPYTFNDLINNRDFPNRQAILEAIGRFTATLHQRGILHRDYSAGNILYTADGTRVEVIDLNRIRMRKRLSRHTRLRNFERLNIDAEALRVMAYAYAEAMHEDKEYDAAYIISHRWYKHRKNTPQNAV